jgi:hypothetical protein
MVHPIQVRHAFGVHRESAAMGDLIAADGTDLLIHLRDDGREQAWRITKDADRWNEVTAGDLCCRDGRPVVLVSSRCRLLAIATGPAEIPDQVRVLYGVVDLSGPRLPPAEAGQPAWELFDAEAVEPDRTSP